MTSPISLPALRAAIAGRTGGEWNVEEIPGEACSVVSGDILVAVAYTGDGPRGLVAYAMSGPQQDANAHAIVAAINSIDALLSLAEAAVRYRDACEATHRFPYRDTLHGTATREYIDAIGARTRAHDALLSLIASRFTATERSGE